MSGDRIISIPEGELAELREAVAEITQECRYCANTGWFYGDPDLRIFCGCDFGKVREELSRSDQAGGQMDDAGEITDDQILELAVCYSLYREGESLEVISHKRLVEFARALLALRQQNAPSGKENQDG